MMRRVRQIKLCVAYEGTDFAGWQRQRGAPTVQEAIEKAVAAVTGECVPVMGAGRTDSGVHALGQVAIFRTESSIPADRFPFALNAHLPPSIRIAGAEVASPDFHPRRSATAKHYRYTLWHDRIAPALWRNFVTVIHYDLWWEGMIGAAPHLVGRRDCRALKTRAKGQDHLDTWKEVREIVLRRAGPWVAIDVLGGGFLYKQVRTTVGTLLEVGRRAMAPAEVAEVLAAGDRRRAGPTAPASGLCLIQVFYGEPPPSWFEVPGPLVWNVPWECARIAAPPATPSRAPCPPK